MYNQSDQSGIRTGMDVVGSDGDKAGSITEATLITSW